MKASSTSFRLSDEVRARLAARAGRDGQSSTALLERLITEGIDALDHPGIVFRGPPQDRRAAIAGGPDVWEIVARLRDLSGPEEERVATVADESALHPRLIRLALQYASENPAPIKARIAHNREMARTSKRAARQRAALLG